MFGISSVQRLISLWALPSSSRQSAITPPIARTGWPVYADLNTLRPRIMLYLAFAFNVLVLAAFAYELHQARKERQSLSLLIKSRDVAEFVRAERSLAKPNAGED